MSSPSIRSAFPGSARRRLRSATADRTLAPVRLGVDLKNGCGLVGVVQWKRTQRFQRLLALGYQALKVGLLLLGEPLAVLAEDGLDFGFHFGTALGRQLGLSGLLHRERFGRREQMVRDHGDTGGRPGCTSGKLAARNAMGRLGRFLFFCHGNVHLRCDSATPALPGNLHLVRRRVARAYWKRRSESTAVWARLESKRKKGETPAESSRVFTRFVPLQRAQHREVRILVGMSPSARPPQRARFLRPRSGQARQIFLVGNFDAEGGS